MIHNVGVIAAALANGILVHLALWEGWAVAIAAALLVRQNAAWWLPIIVAVVINPEPFGIVTGVMHSRHVSLYAALMFTLCQVVLAFGGFGLARLAGRLR